MSELKSLKTKVALVLNGQLDVNLNDYIDEQTYVIAVDGGINHLNAAHLKSDILIGDGDSSASVNDIATIKLATEKDDTDFKVALDYAKDHFPKAQLLIFAFSSLTRIDHLLTNIAHIDNNCQYISKNQLIYAIDKSTIIKQDKYKYISFYSLQEQTTISLEGFKYPLQKYALHGFEPLCISNQIASKNAKVIIHDGRVLVIKSIIS